jgi:ribosomal protein S18 acetylase RimI-like enzyme
VTTQADAEALARAIAFARAADARAAERTEPHQWGVALHDAAHPHTYVLNTLAIDRPLDAGTGAGAVAAELDRLYAGLGHRRVVVDDDATGARIADGLRERGYSASAELVMVLDRAGDDDSEGSRAGEGDRAGPSPRPSARECTEAELRAVERAFMLEEGREQDIADEVLDARSTVCASRPGTRFFVAAHEGRDVASATLYSDGAIAQIEDVGVLADARGHGLGRAVVAAARDAAVAAPHELVFIVGVEDDWPKDLYARMGFRPVGRTWACLREAVSAGGAPAPR